MPIAIEIRNLRLAYQDSQSTVIEGLDISIAAAQWTCLLGRSGCGKTTLLRFLAAIDDEQLLYQGSIAINGAERSGKNCLAGQVAYMAQQDLLLPWLSVLDNVCLAQRFEQQKKAKRDDALQLLKQVGLFDCKDALPQTLSGGMRQRAALARTLMQDKPVVLMDEPFSALDALTRYQLQNLAHALLKNKTVVLITHDPQEALRLADCSYVFHGTPARATEHPLPDSRTPRALDDASGKWLAQIMTMLERADA